MAEAKEQLIRERDTHPNSLMEKMRNLRIRPLIIKIMTGGNLDGESSREDIMYALEQGLLVDERGVLKLTNPIYQKTIIYEKVNAQHCGYLDDRSFIERWLIVADPDVLKSWEKKNRQSISCTTARASTSYITDRNVTPQIRFLYFSSFLVCTPQRLHYVLSKDIVARMFVHVSLLNGGDCHSRYHTKDVHHERNCIGRRRRHSSPPYHSRSFQTASGSL